MSTSTQPQHLAAKRGEAEAQYNLGSKYALGKGLRKNNRRAVKWYRRAAEQGYAEAQYNLGVMYAKGTGVAQDAEGGEGSPMSSITDPTTQAAAALPGGGEVVEKVCRTGIPQGPIQPGGHLFRRGWGGARLCESLCLVESCHRPRRQESCREKGSSTAEQVAESQKLAAEFRDRIEASKLQ